jgi:hypothetical protein
MPVMVKTERAVACMAKTVKTLSSMFPQELLSGIRTQTIFFMILAENIDGDTWVFLRGGKGGFR